MRAESLDPSALLAALKAGRYYSSTGPEIQAIVVRDGQITIGCSPVSRILVTGATPGKHVHAGHALTGCSLPLDRFLASTWIRITVIDASGQRANPIWLNEVAP